MTEELKQAAQRLDDDVRSLSKWLNEEITAPIDRAALARVLHALTQRPAAQTEDDVFMPRRLAATQKLTQLGYNYDSMQGQWLPVPQQATTSGWVETSAPPQRLDWSDTQQATPEPVGEVVAWLYTEDGETKFGHPQGHRPTDARPLVFGDVRPAPVETEPVGEPHAVAVQAFDAMRASGASENYAVRRALDVAVAEWVKRDAFDLAAQMLTWGRDEGLTPEQVNEVDAHAKLMFAMLAAQAKGGQ